MVFSSSDNVIFKKALIEIPDPKDTKITKSKETLAYYLFITGDQSCRVEFIAKLFKSFWVDLEN